MPEVTIEYCVPCGLLDNAIETQQSILDEYGQEIDAVGLKPSHGGVFGVSIDGDVVFDTDENEAGYDLEAVRAAIRTHIGPPT